VSLFCYTQTKQGFRESTGRNSRINGGRTVFRRTAGPQCLHVLPGIPVLLASPPGPAVEPASETAASCKSMPLLFSGGQMRSLVLTDYPKGAKSYHTTRIPELSLHRKVPGSVIWLLPTLGAQEPCREFECQVALQKSTCVSLLFLRCSM
jgi:hypothetical protein